jgi:hypothetical protein
VKVISHKEQEGKLALANEGNNLKAVPSFVEHCLTDKSLSCPFPHECNERTVRPDYRLFAS